LVIDSSELLPGGRNWPPGRSGMANQQGQPDCQENAQEGAHQKAPKSATKINTNIEADDHNAQQVVIMITVSG
jgi:hypothetical protein